MKSKRSAPEKRHLKLVKEQYTLCYGMRLDKGTAPERRQILSRRIDIVIMATGGSL